MAAAEGLFGRSDCSDRGQSLCVHTAVKGKCASKRHTMPRQTASHGQISGYIGGKLCEIRWACCSEALWVHALDLCRALDWQRPSRILRVVGTHAKPAFALGVHARGGEQYLDRDGVEELFQRKTGGNRDAV